MISNTSEITKLILNAAEKAREETKNELEPEIKTKLEWPINCTVGPGLEGAIACESKVGYVNGAKGVLVYRGYNIFDLCAYSSYEEVSYLLLHGELPSERELNEYKNKLNEYKHISATQRTLMSFPIEEMHPMAALRFGIGLLRQKQTYRDMDEQISPIPHSKIPQWVSTDEDSIPMETVPMGTKKAVYEFNKKPYSKIKKTKTNLLGSEDLESCYHLIAGIASITATIARVRAGHLPIEPDPGLTHAGNLLYMITGEKPTPIEERIMDVILILHADHGMNASTFASMVVASTLSDIYFAIDTGVAALSGPLHGGANERALLMLREIGSADNVKEWYENSLKRKKKIMGIGHRVYKAYDPRARILGPLAEYLAGQNRGISKIFKTAKKLEKIVCETIGKEKKLFPNVDFYSGIVYNGMGISPEYYTPLFAVSRIAGWTSRILEYLNNNRIFRPRGIYTGPPVKKYPRKNK